MHVPEKLILVLFLNFFVGWAWYVALEKPLMDFANKLCRSWEQKLNQVDYRLSNDLISS
jgi:hypothetical protein